MILMDGAMGTQILSDGIAIDACLEALNISHPELIRKIHRRYAAAGAQVLVTNTFGANRIRLGPWAKRLEAINRAGVRIARKAAPKAKVFASIGPLGPKGRKLSTAQKYKVFREQAQALVKEKPDGLLIETMISLPEAEAATAAVRKVFNGTVICLVAPVKSLGRWDIAFFRRLSRTLRSAGADILGTNCGKGPKDSLAFFKALARVDSGPLCARPAGGKNFAAWAVQFKKMGCAWFGGCCGTTPATLKAISGSL